MPQIGSIGERLDIVLRQGSTLGPFIVTLTNPNGTPVDLTGATISGQVRKNATDTGSPIATFDIVYINRVAGQFSFGMAKSATTLIPAGDSVSAGRCSCHNYSKRCSNRGGSAKRPCPHPD